jgi:DNA mismatch repair protein MutS
MLETQSNAVRKMASPKLTPLMQQYWDVKAAHPDKIILFRMGDFFEMFHRDAETAAPVLGIALTSRNKKSQDETPMCGVPHHSVSGSINKLLLAGFKVAICDQLEDPKFAKGIVKRGVTRTLSPGMVFDSEILDARTANYLASWDDEQSLAFLDISTGEAFFFRAVSATRRWDFLESLGAVEWVLASASAEDAEQARRLGRSLTHHQNLDLVSADGEILGKSGGTLDTSLDTALTPTCIRRLISYAVSQLSNGEGPLKGAAAQWLATLAPFEERGLESRMVLSNATLRHLEIFGTYRGEREGSLLNAIDRTKTSGGARLLKSWLQMPLVQLSEIKARHDRVEFWLNSDLENRELRARLAKVGDLPRRLQKIGQPSRGPRDLVSLAQSLMAGVEAWKEARKADPTLDSKFPSIDVRMEKVADEISRVLVDEPPVYVRQGGAIRLGARPDLDELIHLSTDAGRLVLELEAREREVTGISSLKVRYNNVFGYSIEITNTHRDRVPLDRYDRKQTLANAERFTTKELSELESKVLSADDRRLKLEEEEFSRLVQFVLKESHDLLKFAFALAELDVVSSLAWLAMDQRYIRPRFRESHEPVALALEGSRHPVIEQTLSMPFVANDVRMQNGQCLLLTGPNMAGKSTLMRQVAIAVIMAQMGSYVPAAFAELSVFDRVSTRIGASDFLSEGLSTFMVEMKETAELLQTAGDRTLVILDEIGRGTATFDGLSLAQSILEYLLTERNTLTLFATHYHELTQLELKFPKIQTGHMAIAEKKGEITFLHRLEAGSAGQSYGIHVAKLAGLPEQVTSRAARILSEIEGTLSFNKDVADQVSSGRHDKGPSPQLAMSFATSNDAVKPAVDPKVRQVLTEIKSFDVDRSTPLEALGKISKWALEIPKDLH